VRQLTYKQHGLLVGKFESENGRDANVEAITLDEDKSWVIIIRWIEDVGDRIVCSGFVKYYCRKYVSLSDTYLTAVSPFSFNERNAFAINYH